MARGRMIETKFWTSETTSALTMRQRLLFIGLFSNADDQGRLRGHPALVRSVVFPYDDVTIEDVRTDLAQIAALGCIQAYSIDGTEYIQVLNWWKYQQLKWAWPSKLPAPDGWMDRMRYRKGNIVVKENWDGDETDVDSAPPEHEITSEQESSHGEATVEPQSAHSETTVRPAPRDSNSGSNSISNSGNGSSNSTPKGAVAAGSDQERCEECRLLAQHQLEEFCCSGAAGLAVMRGPRFAGCWCYKAVVDPGIRDKAAFVAGMIRQGISPPAPPPEWDGWDVYCADECAGTGPVDNGRVPPPTIEELRTELEQMRAEDVSSWLPLGQSQHALTIERLEQELAGMEGERG